MVEAEFWQLIEASGAEAGGDAERHADLLVEHLTAGDVSEVVSFDLWFGEMLGRADTNGLLLAHQLITDDCPSGDGFEYFRCWLIAHGRDAFARAVEDPDAVADLLRAGCPPLEQADGEPLLYVANRACEEMGWDVADDDWPLNSAALRGAHAVVSGYVPPGDDVPDDVMTGNAIAEARRRLPRLAERCEALWSASPERPGRGARGEDGGD